MNLQSFDWLDRLGDLHQDGAQSSNLALLTEVELDFTRALSQLDAQCQLEQLAPTLRRLTLGVPPPRWHEAVSLITCLESLRLRLSMADHQGQWPAACLCRQQMALVTSIAVSCSHQVLRFADFYYVHEQDEETLSKPQITYVTVHITQAACWRQAASYHFICPTSHIFLMLRVKLNPTVHVLFVNLPLTRRGNGAVCDLSKLSHSDSSGGTQLRHQ